MIKNNRFYWWPLVLLSVISLVIWFKFSYPQLSFINFNISRPEAVERAKEFLKSQNISADQYQYAVVFSKETQADRYLQKTIGFEAFKDFISQHDFDLFFWIVRFFKEKEQEEVRVAVSAKSGEITAYTYFVDNNKKIDDTPKEAALQEALSFLKKRFLFVPQEYNLQLDTVNKLDNRTEYSFGWEKIDVQIPWSDEPLSGYGKLTRYVKMAGPVILGFTKYVFNTPPQFERYLSQYSVIENNLMAVVRVLYFLLLAGATTIVIRRRNHLAMHSTKKFYIVLALTFIVVSLSNIANDFQGVLFDYNTTGSFESYFFQNMTNTLLSLLISSLMIVLPSLAGELIHYENFRDHKTGSFLHYLHTTFLSREVTRQICVGYLVWLILLGLQSLMFKIGEKYWGVWIEYSWMGQMSTAYLPFIAALVIGIKAGISEELIYRLFAISWGKKIFKNTVLACIFASVIWGFGHSNYPVFPKWFRGVEVTCVGLFLSFIYLRYGIISVIVAHYLLDVFWGSSSYLLGQVKPFDFYSSLLVLLLPLFYAVAAYFINKPVEDRKMIWKLNKHQQFNANLLEDYLKIHPELIQTQAKENLIIEISQHGWDPGVVETVCNKLYK